MFFRNDAFLAIFSVTARHRWPRLNRNERKQWDRRPRATPLKRRCFLREVNHITVIIATLASAADSSRDLNIVAYNPQTANHERTLDISAEFKQMDIFLSGTARHIDEYLEATQTRADNHDTISWGWNKTRYVNKACGVAILVGKWLHGVKTKVYNPSRTSGNSGACGPYTYINWTLLTGNRGALLGAAVSSRGNLQGNSPPMLPMAHGNSRHTT